MNTIILLSSVLAATTSAKILDQGKPVNRNKNFELLILHNNDMHARFEQTSQLSGTCTTPEAQEGKCYGGFARVAHVVKEARKAAAEGRGPPVLYLNAGDTYTGTAWFTLYKWKIAAEFVNALQPDAVSLGNNELKAGSSELSPFLDNLKTIILASNVIVKSAENKQNLQKSVIFDIEGVKVGLVGYLKPDMDILDSTGNIEYIDEIIALKDEVAKLQTQNVKIIIALGHTDMNKDKEIAKEVEGINIVIGGHKNVFFWNGTNANKQFTDVNEPIIVTQQSGKQVLVVQSYAYNKYLGKMQVNFNSNSEMTSYAIQPILLDASIPQDTETIKIIEEYIEETTSLSEEILGDTAVVLDGESCKVEECNLGNLITDAMMYYYAIRFESDYWTDAPIAIIPGGLIANSISPSNRPAHVTRGNLLASLPTESQIVAVTMNGTVLVQVLEHSVSRRSVSNPTGQFLQFSGIRVVYDLANEPGSRVVSAVVRCWSCYVPEYYPIDDWRDYKVLMPESLADGAYDYSMLVGLPREDLIYDEVTCTAEYIGLKSPVYPEVAGRIEILNMSNSARSSIIFILTVALIPFII